MGKIVGGITRNWKMFELREIGNFLNEKRWENGLMEKYKEMA